MDCFGHRQLDLNLQVSGSHQGCIGAVRLWVTQSFHVMDTVRQSRRLGIIGSIVGLLALLVSALKQLVPATYLAQPVIGQATEAAGPKAKDHVIFQTKRFEITKSREAPEQRTAGTTWNEVLSTAGAALGVLAIAFAVFAVIFREEKLLAGIAAVLGTAAIAVQIWWVLIIVAVAIFVLNAFLS
jgi:hypothetical protein